MKNFSISFQFKNFNGQLDSFAENYTSERLASQDVRDYILNDEFISCIKSDSSSAYILWHKLVSPIGIVYEPLSAMYHVSFLGRPTRMDSQAKMLHNGYPILDPSCGFAKDGKQVFIPLVYTPPDAKTGCLGVKQVVVLMNVRKLLFTVGVCDQLVGDRAKPIWGLVESNTRHVHFATFENNIDAVLRLEDEAGVLNINLGKKRKQIQENPPVGFGRRNIKFVYKSTEL
jgi:hypothetical protein